VGEKPVRLAFLFLLFSQSALAALQLVNAGVRQIEDGPAVPSGTPFVQGETVFYSVQVSGYTIAPPANPAEPDNRKVHLSYTLDAFDPKGVKIVETVQSVLDTTISQQDKEWKPKIRTEILVPPFAPPGKYKVVIAVTDDLTKLIANSETTFEVSGITVESSPELIVRNFGFYRSEDDVKPIPTAAYRAGDTLFARFDMTGFRYGDRNTIDLAYDVAVLNPESKQIYAQPNAAVEKSFSFYPKPYVPGGMNLNLQPDMRKGQYTIVLTVHDFVGKQNYETRQTFDVE
jgi:hypothetical protein